MSKFHREKNSYYWHFTAKSFMVCKFRRLLKKQVTVNGKWELVRFTLSFTVWRRKGYSHPDGEMRDVRNEEGHDDVITNSQVPESQALTKFNPFDQTYSIGNPFEELVMNNPQDNSINSQEAKSSDYPWERLIEDLYIENLEDLQRSKLENQQKLEPPKVWGTRSNIIITPGEKSESTQEETEELSRPTTHLQEYHSHKPDETWATRWIATPIAHLFPAERREEWLGDLYESNNILLQQNYPRWLVNIINVVRTGILIVSAIKIKLSDLLSVKFKSTS
jgi:hypothetical protein